MKRAVNGGWRIALAALTLSVGIAAGSAWVLAEDTAPAAAAAAPARAPAADAKAQAVEHFKKAKALFDQQKFAEATVENDLALTLDPTLFDAKVLRRILADKGGTVAETEPAATGPAAAGRLRLLTESQISLVRLNELAEGEGNIRGSIPRRTLEDFWSDYMLKDLSANVTREQHERFVSPSNFAEQVHKIREAKIAKYMEKVTLTSDPAVIIAFRNTVQPYVLANCATAVCHGGEKGGAFRLAGRYGAVSIQETYTNFYIMSTYVAKDGGKVINRDDPAKSLFIQHGLPRNVAQFAHPDVPGLKARFPDENNELYRSLVDWVKKLAFPRPNYGITYELPTTKPTTAPK